MEIALLIETSNHYARELLHGICSYTRGHDSWSVQLNEQARGERPPGWLSSWTGDGIIARIESERIAEFVSELKIPVVNVSAAHAVPAFPCVKTDDQAIARLAADHLLERGFTNLGFCNIPGFVWSEQRCEHFRRIVEKAGHRCSVYSGRAQRGRPDPWKQDMGSLGAWIRELRKPVGIMAAWDGCGQQVLSVCRHLRVAVPEEVSVIGVDNDELVCDLATPPLSSVDPDAYSVGYRAARLLDRMIGGEKLGPLIEQIPPLGVETKASTDRTVGDDFVSEAAKFIRENACKGIKVQDVLNCLPLSRRVLDDRFKKVLGKTPHEYIADVRLTKVRDLLIYTDLPQAEIAERCGFNHAEYMSVAFKRKYGVAPGDFRLRNPR